jgi:hypothetical protein
MSAIELAKWEVRSEPARVWGGSLQFVELAFEHVSRSRFLDDDCRRPVGGDWFSRA